MKRSKPQSNCAKPKSFLPSNRKRKLDKAKSEEKIDQQKEPKNEVEPHKKFAVYAKKSMNLLKSWYPPFKKRNCSIEIDYSADPKKENLQLSTLEKNIDRKNQWKPPQTTLSGNENRITTELRKAIGLSEETNLSKTGNRPTVDESELKNVSLEVSSCSDGFHGAGEINKGKRIDNLARSAALEKSTQTAVVKLKTAQENDVKDFAAENKSDNKLHGNPLRLEKLNPLVETKENSQGNETKVNLTPVSNDVGKEEVEKPQLIQESRPEPNRNHQELFIFEFPKEAFLKSQGDKQEAVDNLICDRIETNMDKAKNNLSNKDSDLQSNSDDTKLTASIFPTMKVQENQDDEQETQKNVIRRSPDASRNKDIKYLSDIKASQLLEGEDGILTDSNFPTKLGLVSQNDKQESQRGMTVSSDETNRDESTEYVFNMESQKHHDQNQLVPNIPRNSKLSLDEKRESKKKQVEDSVSMSKDEVSPFPSGEKSNLEFDSNFQCLSTLNSRTKNNAEFGKDNEQDLVETKAAAETCPATSFKEISKEEEQSSDDDLDEIILKTIEKHLKGEIRLEKKLRGVDQSDTDDESSLDTFILTPKNYQQTKTGLKGEIRLEKELRGVDQNDTDDESSLDKLILTPKNYLQTKTGLKGCSYNSKEAGTNLDETVILTPEKYNQFEGFVGHLNLKGEKGNHLDLTVSSNSKVYPEFKTDSEGNLSTLGDSDITNTFAENTNFSERTTNRRRQVKEKKDTINSSLRTIEKPINFKDARVFNKNEESANFNPEIQYCKKVNNFVEMDSASQFLNTEKVIVKSEKIGQRKVSIDDYILEFKKTEEADFFLGLDDDNFSSLKPSSLSNILQEKDENNAYRPKEGDTLLDIKDKQLKGAKNCNQDYVAEILSSSQDNHMKNKRKSNIEDLNKRGFRSFSDLCKSGFFDQKSSNLSQEYVAMLNFVNINEKKNIPVTKASLNLANCDQQPQKIRENVELNRKHLVSESLYGMNSFQGQQQPAAFNNFLGEKFGEEERFPDGQYTRKSFASQQFDGKGKSDFVLHSLENKILPLEPSKTFSSTNDSYRSYPCLRDERSFQCPDLLKTDESALSEKVMDQLKTLEGYLDTRNKEAEVKIGNIEDLVSQTRSLVQALVKKLK